MGVGAGLGIMGGILGGVGDIMQAAKYQRPSLPEPGGQEARLRSLAQGQLIGGGLESLAGTQLYNQLAPILMGMAPGMKMTPSAAAAAGVGGGAAGAAGAGGAGGMTNAPMANYQSALANYQNAVGRNQQIQNLQDQLKTMPKGPSKQATRQQLQQLKKQGRGQPTVPQLERQIYQAGTTPPQINVSQGDITQSPATGAGTLGGQQLSPTAQSTLSQIMGWMHGATDAASGTQTPPLQGAQGSFISDYQNALNAPSPMLPMPSTGQSWTPSMPSSAQSWSQPTSTG